MHTCIYFILKIGSDPLLGDLLCVAGTFLYGISNVAEEYLVRNHSISEWLAFIGIVGCVISGIQLLVNYIDFCAAFAC